LKKKRKSVKHPKAIIRTYVAPYNGTKLPDEHNLIKKEAGFRPF